jgi:hypothetical protein
LSSNADWLRAFGRLPWKKILALHPPQPELQVGRTWQYSVYCLTSIAPDNLRGRVLSGITTAFFLGQFLSPLISQPLSKAIRLGSTYGAAALLRWV